MRLVVSRLLAVVPLAIAAAPAGAQTPTVPAGQPAPEGSAATPAPEAAAPAAAPAPAAPAPYSLPWQLRPAMPVSVVRSDSTVAFLEDASGNGGATVASMLLVSYKVIPALAPMLRLGFVANEPPGTMPSGRSLVNPALGATWGRQLRPDLRLAIFLGVTIPVGQGGGNTPDAATAAATKSGILARSALDNAMFAVNDLTVFPGVDLAWTWKGLTVQGEATLLQLTRVRGDIVQKQDSSKTNLTAGLHVGYFVVKPLSVAAELRHQRWLSTPAAVAADDAARDTTTFALGVRGHIQVGTGLWLRPGVAWVRGVDAPMTRSGYDIVQVDVPFVF